MGAMASSSKDREEQVAPPVVRQMASPIAQVQREQVAPQVLRQVTLLAVPAQRELEFRGSRPSRSRREEQPSRTV
jgi:hypothetical protein